KNENPRSTEQQYIPLVRVPKAKVEQYLESLSPRFEEGLRLLFSKVERIRPRWLISRGYIIALIHNDSFKSAILRTAPKHRGKYRVNPEALKRLLKDPDQSMISLLDPSVLHSDELKNW